VGAAADRVAGTGAVALVGGRAGHRRAGGAGALLAGVALGAGVAIVAGGAVGLGLVGAGARGRVADADVAWIRAGAGHRGAGLADAGAVARLCAIAGGAVRAGGAGGDRSVMHPRGRVAGVRRAGVAVVDRYRGAGLAGAGLAGVPCGAGVTITARAAVGL